MRTIYESINNLPLPKPILECNYYLAVQITLCGALGLLRLSYYFNLSITLS
jgi:hypothetical protein